jgi:hypothetical protein
MGNCLFNSQEIHQQQSIGEKKKISSPSVASTASIPSGWPISPEFVTRSDNTTFSGELCRSILRVIFGPDSFVVINPATGIVLVSVHRINRKQLSVSTPDGRLVGTVWIDKRNFELNNLSAIKRDDGEIIIQRNHDDERICQIVNDKFVGPIPRGIDLVVVCVLVSAIASN